MNQNPFEKWPPIIELARAPWWVRIRDVLVTIAAWAGILYLARGAVYLIVDYFSDPIFELTRTHSPDWLELWHHLKTFVIFSGVGMLWLMMWGIIHRRRLRRVAWLAPVPPLPLEEHAAYFQLDPAMVQRWTEMKTIVVQFDENHRIVNATTPPTELRSNEASAREEELS